MAPLSEKWPSSKLAKLLRSGVSLKASLLIPSSSIAGVFKINS
jgi:hypothetical protein